MKLLKRMAVLSLCVIAVSGCTKSSISTQAPVSTQEFAGDEIDSEKLADLEEEYVEKAPLVEDETEEESRFDWEQVTDESEDLFGDEEFYPETVKMEYAADEAAQTIELTWVLKNGTSEETAMEYAAELVQSFNDILAVQVTDVDFATAESFGGIWNEYALTVKVGTEDGTWMIDKSYAAGDEIDLVLPEYSGEGPSADLTEERISPNQGPKEAISPAMGATEEAPEAPGK